MCRVTLAEFDRLLLDQYRVVIVDKAKLPNPLTLRGMLQLEAALAKDLQKGSRSIRQQAIKALMQIGAQAHTITEMTAVDQLEIENKVKTVVARYGINLEKIAIPILEDHFLKTDKLVRKNLALSQQAEELKDLPAFNVQNQGALKGLANQQRLFIYKQYDENISQQVSKAMIDNMAEQGGSAAQVARSLARDVGGAFVSADEEYLKIVATNNMNTARSYSALSSYWEVGIVRYSILVVDDERTSQVCKNLIGKTFEVQKALQVYDNMMKAQTYDEMVASRPFLQDEMKNGQPTGAMFIKQGQEKIYFDQDTMASDLAKFGIMFPPFHHRCRTTIIADV